MFRAFSIVAILAAATFAASAALAQTAPTSDLLTEFVTNHHVDAAGNPVPIIPGLSIPIPEPPAGATEGALTFTVPALTIDFVEPGSAAQIKSDRLHIDPFQVRIVSDDEIGLQPRTGVKVIPASANEAFLPVSIFAHSDGENPTNPTGESDHLVITLGFFGAGSGTTFLDVHIPEPTPGDPAPEPAVPFTIPATGYDIVDPTPGSALPISDYFDHGQITGFFLSSDNQADYGTIVPDGTVVEDGLPTDPFYGGDAHYALGFTSDTEMVPEPGSLTLLGLGLLGIGFCGRRRMVRA